MKANPTRPQNFVHMVGQNVRFQGVVRGLGEVYVSVVLRVSVSTDSVTVRSNKGEGTCACSVSVS